MAAVVRSAVDLAVVCRDDGVVDEDESGASVSNGVNAGRLEVTTANTVAGTGELPEALRVVDSGVGDVAGVLAGVDEAEVVGAWLALLEVSCEDVLVEDTLVDGGIEEGGLGCRCDSVDGAESKTEETVVIGVLLKLSADRLGGLDCLLGDGHTSDSDGVGIDVATGAGPIAVRDTPGSTRE